MLDVVALVKGEEVFVGREKEIKQLFKFLKDEKSSAFIVIGEPGIGKSSYLEEVVRRIRKDSKNSGVFVGFHWVLDGTTNVASPFVRVLDDLMANLSVSLAEKAKEEAKRALSVAKKIFSEKGRRFAKSLVKSFAVKWWGKEAVEELEKAYEEWKETPDIESYAEKIFSDYKDEFVYDFVFFFHRLAEMYEKLEFVLVIDQFERAPLISSTILLGFARAKPERVHVAVSFKVEKKGVVKYESIRSELLQLNAQFLRLPPLSPGEIGEWVLKARKKEFSHPDLRKIRRLSGGFPFLISNWLRFSENLELAELRVGREGYCEVLEWCFEGLSKECLLFLRRISVLLQPLAVDEYERLTGVKTGECSLLLEELERNWILLKQTDTFWFRHDLIKPCIERKLSSSEIKNYHLSAAKFFEEKFDSAVKAGGVEFTVGLGCGYHLHNAGEYEKSLSHNSRFARLCFDIGSLDISEECYRRAIDAAQQLKDEDSAMVAKGNLANVYRVWGRLSDAYRTHGELLEYFREEKDRGNESVALHQQAMIEQDRGNYDKATELYNQSLQIKQELGDKAGIATSTGAIGTLFEKKEEFEDTFKSFLKAAYLFHQLGSTYEKHALSDMARTAQKLGEEKFNKALQETPHEIKAYLKQATQKLQKQKKISNKKHTTQSKKEAKS